MKRVLVISNNCFSKTNSNGRTLGNLFYSYEKDKISQFYISGTPDYSFCNNYFNVCDEDVINSIFPFKKVTINKKDNKPLSVKKRTVKNMLLRNVAWNLGLWKNKKYKEWLDQVAPEVVILQVGDCEFMNRLAIKISKKYGAKLIIFNTEVYYFKDFNYFQDHHDFLYKIFIRKYRKQFDKLMTESNLNIYLSDDLKKEYNKRFEDKSIVIYNSSDIVPYSYVENPHLVFSYFGNLGLGRDASLCLIAKCLSEINSNYKLHIFGKADEKQIEEFKTYSNIIYHGFVSYEEVKDYIYKSDVLVHTESFDADYIMDSKFGFSGKIADYLCCGRPMLVFSPDSISFYKYLSDNHVCALASSVKELKEQILYLSVFSNRVNTLKKQIYLGENNHDILNNSLMFAKSINDLGVL